jgi:hypothetical protein
LIHAPQEIIFGFLQFLGLYSEYAVEWPEGMQSIFDALLFFNLDVDMMQFQCTTRGPQTLGSIAARNHDEVASCAPQVGTS